MFWIVVVGMLLLAGAFVLYPVWRGSRDRVLENVDTAPDLQMNVALYRERAADLETWAVPASAAEREQLLEEAQQQLLADHQQVAEQTAWRGEGAGAVMLCCLLIVLTATVIYWKLGAIDDVGLADQLATYREDGSNTQAEELRSAVAERLASAPDNVHYWLIQARLAERTGDLSGATESYRRALALAPNDAEIKASLAQVLFLRSDNRVTEEVAALVTQTLTLEPDNGLGLQLAGIGAFSSGDYASALIFWQRALAVVGNHSVHAAALQSGIDAARDRLERTRSEADRRGDMPSSEEADVAANGATLSAANGDAEDSKKRAVEALLSVTVDIAPDLAQTHSIPPESTVYVYLKSWQGPPMPLAAVRYRALDLPLTVAFSDDMALSSARNISQAGPLEVIARVALGGVLTATSGDLEGRRGPVEPGDLKSLTISIDTVVP